MRHTDTLIEELLTYRRITNEHGTETYTAPSGGHDDLVLALSLALWLTEQRPPSYINHSSGVVPRGNIPGIPRTGPLLKPNTPESPLQPRSNHATKPTRSQEAAAIRHLRSRQQRRNQSATRPRLSDGNKKTPSPASFDWTRPQ